MNKILYPILGLFTLVILNNCANQKPPTGGKKDEKPPNMLSSIPQQETLNFKGDQIELVFDEDIQLKNAKEEIIITPRISSDYEIKYKKDRVIIELEEPLLDSTTYTFNFRDAIQDLNEGNPAENLKLAFSTGNILDSLHITGTVNQLLTNKKVDKATVSLYQSGDTLNPLKHAPLYFTKTDKQGHYQFDNIKAGNYQLIVLQDKNNNLFIDPKNESYGFYENTINLLSHVDFIDLTVQHLDIRPIEFQGARQSGTTFNIKYNKHITSYSLTSKDSLSFISNFTDNQHNTIQIFDTNTLTDSSLVIITAYDSLSLHTSDTVYVKFEATQRKPQKLEANFQFEEIIINNGILTGTATFTKPIKHTLYDSMYIYIDSLHSYSIDSSHLSFNDHRDQLRISYPFDITLFQAPEASDSTTVTKTDNPPPSKNKRKKTIKPYIKFGQNSFISIEYDTLQEIKKDLIFKKPSDYGTLEVQINTTSNYGYIVQLMNKDYQVKQEKSNTTSFSFYNILPGDYRLRVLIDSNNNGHWDPGNFLENKSPEDIIYYINSDNKELFPIRANWVVGPYIITF